MFFFLAYGNLLIISVFLFLFPNTDHQFKRIVHLGKNSIWTLMNGNYIRKIVNHWNDYYVIWPCWILFMLVSFFLCVCDEGESFKSNSTKHTHTQPFDSVIFFLLFLYFTFIHAWLGWFFSTGLMMMMLMIHSVFFRFCVVYVCVY